MFSVCVLVIQCSLNDLVLHLKILRALPHNFLPINIEQAIITLFIIFIVVKMLKNDHQMIVNPSSVCGLDFRYTQPPLFSYEQMIITYKITNPTIKKVFLKCYFIAHILHWKFGNSIMNQSTDSTVGRWTFEMISPESWHCVYKVVDWLIG